MFNLRNPLIVGAAPAGLAIASLAWFVIGGAQTANRPLMRLEARLASDRPPTVTPPVPSSEGASLLANPLFALTTGPGATPNPQIALNGVALSNRDKSALLSVGGKPAGWVELDATVDGVTVMQISASSIVVDTPIGFKVVPLWGAPPPPASGASTPPPAPRSPAPR